MFSPQALPIIAASLSSSIASMDMSTRLKPQAPLQLPTVCVSVENSGILTTRPLPILVSGSSPGVSNSTSPIPPSGSFSLGSALFNSDLSADHPGLLRSETAGATSAMQMQSDKWLTYREERTRSSSSDSGVTSQFSPPNLPSTSSVSISPPAFSPLHISSDSAFSTPSAANASRFVFPVAQNPLSRNVSLGHDSVFGEAVAPSTSPDTKTLEESLLRIRTVSESIEQIDEFSDEIKQSIAKKPLERKTSVIHPTPTRPIPQKGNVFRSESLPVRFPTIVENPDHPVIQPHNEFANSVNMLMTFQRMMHVNPFLTAALSPNIQIPVHSKSVSPVTPFDPTQQPTPLEELSVDGKRQYICRYCKKDFKRPDILSRHLRRHTGEKPFHCEDCGRYFSRSDHLRTHQRTHTDEKPYKCTHCPYAARRRDVLTRHMSTKHQAKAGKSVFQRHRTVRRCVSDGDVSLATSASATNPRELTPVEVIVARSSPLIKRERHTTELALPTQPLIHAPRARHVTEIPSMSQEDMPDSDLDEDELEDEDSEDVESVIDVTKIEDDVIVDEEMPEHVPEEGVESIQEPQS